MFPAVVISGAVTSCRWEAATICPRPCTRRTLRLSFSPSRLACGAQRALLPVAVGSMNIHDVCDRRQTDVTQKHRLLSPPIRVGHNNELCIFVVSTCEGS